MRATNLTAAVQAGEARGARARALALVLLAAIAGGCGSTPGKPPRPTTVTPDRGPSTVPVAVRIGGDGFGTQVSADFSGGGGDVVDARFQALLGATALEDVALRPDGTLDATVPAGLPIGVHDLTVIDPSGRLGTLPQAYRALPDGMSAVAVAGFRVEPVGPQVAFAPFTVAVSAVDETGAVVTDFAGEATLSDGSGAVVPSSLGLFVDGQWIGTVEVRAAHAADLLTVSEVGGATGASGVFEVAAPPPASVRFDDPAPTVQAGACAGPVRLTLGDAFGAPTVAGAPVTVTVAGSPGAGFTVYADAGCSAAAAPTVAAGQGSASFWFVATRAGPVRLEASGPSLAGDAITAAVVAGAPAALAFVTPPLSAAAGACAGLLTIEVRDAWGNPSSAGLAAVALAAAPQAGVTFSVDSCSGAVTSVAVPAGVATVDLSFRATAAGGVRITASSPGLEPAVQDEVIAPGAASALAFTTPPRAAAAGDCSGALVVEARDGFGNAAVAARALRLDLSPTPSAGFALYADAGCTTAAAPAIAAGASAATFFYRGTVAGEVVLDAAAPSLTGASQTERVDPGAPAALRFASAPQTVEVQACSAAAALELLDAFGNVAPAPAALSAGLGATPAGMSFFADAACAVPAAAATVPAGARASTFHFRAAAVGGYSVTAAAAGLAPATQAETVVAAGAAQLAFTTAPLAATAGTCSGPLTVESRDGYGNPVALSETAATVVSLAAPGVSLYRNGGCGGAPLSSVTFAARATSASVYLRGTVAGPVTVTASAAGIAAATQTESILPATAVALAFVTAPQTVAAGSCSGAVTVEARDAYGNAAVISEVLPTAIGLAAGALTLHADAACATAPMTSATLAAGATTASFQFRGTAPGAVSVTATASGVGSVSQTETIVAAAASQLAFTTAAQTVAAGSCSGTVTVEARDAYGNAAVVSGTAATPVSLASGLGLYAGAGCAGGAVTAVSLAAGATSASLSFRGTAAGSETIAASAAGVASASQTETIVAAAASQLAFTTAAQTVAAGSCSGTVTVEARDAYGNAAVISEVLPTAIGLAAGALTLHADAACATAPMTSATLAAGATTASFQFRGTAAGPETIAASAAGVASASQTETIVAAAASQLAFTTAPKTVAAGACSGAVTIESSDPWGNPAAVPAATTVTLASGLTLHAGSACAGSAVGSVTLEPAAATTTFSFVGFAAGSAAVTATATGLAGAGQLETVVAAPASRLRFLTTAQTVVAGECSGLLTIEARDAWDNPSIVSTTAVTEVTLSAVGLAYFTAADCGSGAVLSAALAAGATTTTFHLRGTLAGVVRLTASAGGLGSTFQDETVTAGPVEAFAWSAISSPQQDGAPFAVTVTAVDAFGNTAAYAGTATLSAAPGTVSCASACTSAAETSAFTAGRWTGMVIVPAPGTGVTLTATGAGRSGTSGAFDVGGPASRSPPFASFTASTRIVTSGGTVSFDASGSSDYQTPLSSLSVSWHFEARDGDYASTVAPPSSPWTAWSSAKTATHAYLNNTGAPIVYRPRLAVRDDEAGAGGPDVGYATGVVIVLPDASNICVVNTDALTDDSGSTSCDVKGPDGVTSLPEALRAANASAAVLNVVFSGTRNIVSAGGTTLSVTRPVRIVASPGAVVLDGVSLSIAAANVLVSGLELAHLAAPLTVSAAGDALLEDLHVHDGRGIEVQGRARIVRARMSGCTGVACVRANGAGAYLATFFSDLRGAGGGVGISFDACALADPDAGGSSPYLAFANGWSSTGAAFVGATVLAGFGTGVVFGPAASCANPLVTNVTFDRNATGVTAPYAGYVLDSVFTRQTVSAVDAAACGNLTLNVRNVTWENASDGCASSGAQLVHADPLYVFPGARDYRLQFASPAKDAANAGNNVEVDDAGPGLFLGAAPDRGGRETY